uniref:Uncharacterized protein n=1 Tax=Panagrolaimus sp. JU765 TaxID=591449 RepID=A0AC34QSJ1_9BILA
MKWQTLKEKYDRFGASKTKKHCNKKLLPKRPAGMAQLLGQFLLLFLIVQVAEVRDRRLFGEGDAIEVIREGILNLSAYDSLMFQVAPSANGKELKLCFKTTSEFSNNTEEDFCDPDWCGIRVKQDIEMKRGRPFMKTQVKMGLYTKYVVDNYATFSLSTDNGVEVLDSKPPDVKFSGCKLEVLNGTAFVEIVELNGKFVLIDTDIQEQDVKTPAATVASFAPYIAAGVVVFIIFVGAILFYFLYVRKHCCEKKQKIEPMNSVVATVDSVRGKINKWSENDKPTRMVFLAYITQTVVDESVEIMKKFNIELPSEHQKDDVGSLVTKRLAIEVPSTFDYLDSDSEDIAGVKKNVKAGSLVENPLSYLRRFKKINRKTFSSLFTSMKMERERGITTLDLILFLEKRASTSIENFKHIWDEIKAKAVDLIKEEKSLIESKHGDQGDYYNFTVNEMLAALLPKFSMGITLRAFAEELDKDERFKNFEMDITNPEVFGMPPTLLVICAMRTDLDKKIQQMLIDLAKHRSFPELSGKNKEGIDEMGYPFPILHAVCTVEQFPPKHVLDDELCKQVQVQNDVEPKPLKPMPKPKPTKKTGKTQN